MSFTAETYASGTTPLAQDTRRILQVKTLTAINAGGGGGGSGGAGSGPGDPSGAPSGGNGTWFNTTTGSFWAWSPATSSWSELIA